MEVKCNKAGTYKGCKACPHNVTHIVTTITERYKYKCTEWTECAVVYDERESRKSHRVRCCNVKNNLKCWDKVESKG